MNFWKKEVNPIKVFAKPPKSYKEKCILDMKNVVAEIKVENDFFKPKQNNLSYIDVFCNSCNQETVPIFPYGSKSIDCGIRVKIPLEYKLNFSLDNSWASKGLITNSSDILDYFDEENLKIKLINLNEKVIFITNKDKLGKLWIEPIYFFNIK